MKVKPANTMDVKRQNRVHTLRCIFSHERISQPELAQELGLSWPTVLQNVKELTALGLIQDVGCYESTGGRKARAFAPVNDAKAAVGVDITAQHIDIVLADLSGQMLSYKQEVKPFTLTDAYSRELANLVEVFIQETKYPKEKILGVGISLPGIINADETVLEYSHALGLHNVETKQFSKYIPYTCRFMNDANAAGFAEFCRKKGIQTAVYLSLSDSIGGAILRNGSLYMGDNLRAGEFGHMALVPDGNLCYCGKRGCLDAYCSAKVLSQHTDGNLQKFFEQLHTDNIELQKVWETYLNHLSVAVNNLRMAFDCDVIVGGYVGGLLGEYVNELRERLAQRNTFESNAAYLKTCQYKLGASAMGTALLQIEQFLSQV